MGIHEIIPFNYNDPTGHLQKEADDGGLDPIAVVRHLNDEYDWNMVGDWNIKQLLATWDAAIELRLYVGNVRGEDGTGWMRMYFGGTNFSKSTFGPFSNGTCMGIDNKNVILAEDFESKWAYEGGTVGLIIHELGHVLDNRIGLNIDLLKAGALPYPAVMIGGGPADALYMLLGGNISESQAFKRYAGGVSFANDPIRSFRAPYQYGNNSPADYFAHTLAVSVVNQASVPFMASLWMSSFIYLLP